MARKRWTEYRVEYLEPGSKRWETLRSTTDGEFADATAREAREGTLYRLAPDTAVRIRAREVEQVTTPWGAP